MNYEFWAVQAMQTFPKRKKKIEKEIKIKNAFCMY